MLDVAARAVSALINWCKKIMRDDARQLLTVSALPLTRRSALTRH